MSSTNRSGERLKHVSDYYVTPIDKITEFLDEFVQYIPFGFLSKAGFEMKFVNNAGIGFNSNSTDVLKILDPCAGGDPNHPMSYPTALIKAGICESNIDTMDIRPDSLASVKGNYLETDMKDKYDIIITNPPFLYVQEIIDKAIDDVKKDGYVIMLLRLNYFGAKKRREFWKTRMPLYAFVHSRRPSFTDDGKTDSIEYMHCVWKKDEYPEFANLKVIG